MSELVGPSRKFITESDVIFLSKGKAKQRRFFLFNDLLVLSKVINKKKDIANFKEKIPLHFIVCSDVTHQAKLDTPADISAFLLLFSLPSFPSLSLSLFSHSLLYVSHSFHILGSSFTLLTTLSLLVIQ